MRLRSVLRLVMTPAAVTLSMACAEPAQAGRSRTVHTHPERRRRRSCRITSTDSREPSDLSSLTGGRPLHLVLTGEAVGRGSEGVKSRRHRLASAVLPLSSTPKWTRLSVSAPCGTVIHRLVDCLIFGTYAVHAIPLDVHSILDRPAVGSELPAVQGPVTGQLEDCQFSVHVMTLSPIGLSHL